MIFHYGKWKNQFKKMKKTWILALFWKLLDHCDHTTTPWDTQIFGYAGACL